MENTVSAKDLGELLEQVENFTVYIGDRPLFKDEIVIDFLEKKVVIREMIYHEDVYKKAQKFKEDVNKAFEKYMIK